MAGPSLPPALVLTAGRGRRLDPLTRIRAKPAVPIAGTPLIVRILGSLADRGVPGAVLNLHHRAHTITAEVGHGADIGIPVRYSWEPTLLGSGGGPRRARDLLGSRFLIVNGDTLVDLDLLALLDTHTRAGALVTMAVTANPDPARYGGVLVDTAGRVTGFSPPGLSAPHFVGVQVVESAAFDTLAAGAPASTVGGLYDALISDKPGAIAAHHVAAAAFQEIGTPADYLMVCAAVATSERRRALGVGVGSHVHDTAVLSRTVVWNDVAIGAHCHLVDCIVTDGARIPPGRRYRRAIITRDADGHGVTPLVPDGERTA